MARLVIQLQARFPRGELERERESSGFVHVCAPGKRNRLRLAEYELVVVVNVAGGFASIEIPVRWG